MTNRHTPPGRMSKLSVVVVKPFGPHHCARCLGSVKAAYTSSRGASNSRIPIIARGSLLRSRLLFSATLRTPGFRAPALGSCCLRFLGLELLQVIVEAVETLVVEAAIMFEPVIDLFQRARLNAARPPLRFAAARDQAGALKHLEMLRHRRQRHSEGLGQLEHRSVAKRQPRQNGAAGRISQCRKGGVE